MKLIYTENPLGTVVELDKREKHILRLKLMIRKLEGDLFYCQSLDQTRLEENFLKNVEAWLESYIEDLKGSHYGDCICNCITCGKCVAEELLGIETWFSANPEFVGQIAAVFKIVNTTVDAIKYLETNSPTSPTTQNSIKYLYKYAEFKKDLTPSDENVIIRDGKQA